MPNKDRKKRSVRKARAEQRAALEAEHKASAAGAAKQSKGAKAVFKKTEPEAAPAKPAKKEDPKNKGFIARVLGYFSDVRSELHRVVWPSRTELKNYSIAVIAMLIVVGIIVWAVDTGVVAALTGFISLPGLRG